MLQCICKGGAGFSSCECFKGKDPRSWAGKEGIIIINHYFEVELRRHGDKGFVEKCGVRGLTKFEDYFSSKTGNVGGTPYCVCISDPM